MESKRRLCLQERAAVLALCFVLAGAQVANASVGLFNGGLALRGTLAPLAGVEPFGLSASHPELGHYRQRWLTTFEQIKADRAILDGCRHDGEHCPDAARRLLTIIEAGRQLSGRARLGAINRAVNLAIRYMSDADQHGRAEEWSAPLATFASGRGDCEDYALAKYLALTQAGVPGESLKLVIVEDVKRRRGHAVLAASVDGEWLILDNTRFLLVPDRELPQYRPLMAFDSSDHAPDASSPATEQASGHPGTRAPAS